MLALYTTSPWASGPWSDPVCAVAPRVCSNCPLLSLVLKGSLVLCPQGGRTWPMARTDADHNAGTTGMKILCVSVIPGKVPWRLPCPRVWGHGGGSPWRLPPPCWTIPHPGQQLWSPPALPAWPWTGSKAAVEVTGGGVAGGIPLHPTPLAMGGAASYNLGLYLPPSRKSFYSGHASFAMYSMTYLVVSAPARPHRP